MANDNIFDLWGDDGEAGTGYEFPLIQWGHGDKKLAKKGNDYDSQGGWFISEDSISGLNDAELVVDLPGRLLENGWVENTLTTQDGNEIPGFWATTIEVAPILNRKKWIVDGNEYGGRNGYDNASKAGHPKSRTHIMVLLRGLTDLGPFIISAGPAVSMTWDGAPAILSAGFKGIRAQHIAKIQPLIKAQYKKARAAIYTVWTPVGIVDAFIEMGPAGNTSFLKVPQPLWGDEIDLDSILLNREEIAIARRYIAEQKEWVEAWDGLNGSDTEKPEPKMTKEEEEIAEMI